MAEQRPGLFTLKGLIWKDNKIFSPQQTDFEWANVGVMDANSDPYGKSMIGINSTWNLSILRDYIRLLNGIVVLLKTAGKTVEYKNGVVRSRQAIVCGLVWWHETKADEFKIAEQTDKQYSSFNSNFNSNLSSYMVEWESMEIPVGYETKQPYLSLDPTPNVGEVWQLATIAAAEYFNRQVFPMKDILPIIGNQRQFTYAWLEHKEKEKEELARYATFFSPRKKDA